MTTFQSRFSTVRQDAGAADHDRESRLDRLEQRLAEREVALDRRERLIEQRETPTTSNPAPTLLHDRRSADGVVMMTADGILRAAAKARGEIIDKPEPISAAAEAILKAGRRRRGEED
jgi:hypothetical protein